MRLFLGDSPRVELPSILIAITVAATPSSYVIVGAGKTATDGIVWLLANGVPPDRIVWIRSRDPWMLNRAVVQPDPAVALGLAADTMAAAADAESSAATDLAEWLVADGTPFREAHAIVGELVRRRQGARAD